MVQLGLMPCKHESSRLSRKTGNLVIAILARIAQGQFQQFPLSDMGEVREWLICDGLGWRKASFSIRIK
jgi:hypothetical protein